MLRKHSAASGRNALGINLVNGLLSFSINSCTPIIPVVLEGGGIFLSGGTVALLGWLQARLISALVQRLCNNGEQEVHFRLFFAHLQFLQEPVFPLQAQHF